mmetsp:Transcript_48930/g.104052  ORF Transcript_48930/g.104052 Transcript_48930/m.104052 type:complete len:163 (-) Transcript_48930:41-529(-)
MAVRTTATTAAAAASQVDTRATMALPPPTTAATGTKSTEALMAADTEVAWGTVVPTRAAPQAKAIRKVGTRLTFLAPLPWGLSAGMASPLPPVRSGTTPCLGLIPPPSPPGGQVGAALPILHTTRGRGGISFLAGGEALRGRSLMELAVEVVWRVEAVLATV